MWTFWESIKKGGLLEIMKQLKIDTAWERRLEFEDFSLENEETIANGKKENYQFGFGRNYKAIR